VFGRAKVMSRQSTQGQGLPARVLVLSVVINDVCLMEQRVVQTAVDLVYLNGKKSTRSGIQT